MMYWTRSGDLIIMVVLGGMGSVIGPLIGAVALLVLEEVLLRHHRILADHPRAAAAAGGAVRARRHRRPARARCAQGAPMSEPLLQVENLAKRFGGIVATDDLALSVAAGELHAVIGPNGAGKTTLIAQLGGQLRAGCRPHPLCRQRHHRAADVPAQPARPCALVPDHVVVSRSQRARQCGAGGAGACRALVPLLARCARRNGVARAGARGAGPRRP